MLSTLLPFGLISLTWLAIGIALVVAPTSWQSWLKRFSTDPLKRFLLSQGMLLMGLLLIAGSDRLRGRWLWVVLGTLIVLKGLLFLGLNERSGRSWFALWERAPAAITRLGGVMLLALATLLAIDTIGGFLQMVAAGTSS